jgi:hypothetical protein
VPLLSVGGESHRADTEFTEISCRFFCVLRASVVKFRVSLHHQHFTGGLPEWKTDYNAALSEAKQTNKIVLRFSLVATGVGIA